MRSGLLEVECVISLPVLVTPLFSWKRLGYLYTSCLYSSTWLVIGVIVSGTFLWISWSYLAFYLSISFRGLYVLMDGIFLRRVSIKTLWSINVIYISERTPPQTLCWIKVDVMEMHVWLFEIARFISSSLFCHLLFVILQHFKPLMVSLKQILWLLALVKQRPSHTVLCCCRCYLHGDDRSAVYLWMLHNPLLALFPFVIIDFHLTGKWFAFKSVNPLDTETMDVMIKVFNSVLQNILIKLISQWLGCFQKEIHTLTKHWDTRLLYTTSWSVCVSVWSMFIFMFSRCV